MMINKREIYEEKKNREVNKDTYGKIKFLIQRWENYLYLKHSVVILTRTVWVFQFQKWLIQSSLMTWFTLPWCHKTCNVQYGCDTCHHESCDRCRRSYHHHMHLVGLVQPVFQIDLPRSAVHYLHLLDPFLQILASDCIYMTNYSPFSSSCFHCTAKLSKCVTAGFYVPKDLDCGLLGCASTLEGLLSASLG